jgi:regulator of protease activity HflC (stomatin/prohibitin superfamily)
MSNGIVAGAGIIVIGTLLFGGIGGCMYAYPKYNVYSQRMDGEAELAKAESNRQIKVREAQASYDAADLTAKAEVRRAEGVAAANKIIAEGLGGSEGYLRWRFIEMLEASANSPTRQIIYVPTEAGLPILEAGKRAE